MRWLAWLGCLSLVACGDTGSSSTGSEESSTTSGASTTSSSPGSGDDGTTEVAESSSEGETGATPCDPSALEPGDHIGLELQHADVTRTYDVHVPPSYTGNDRVPLYLNFHGYLGDPAQQTDFSQMNGTSDEHGFVVAYPAGLSTSWNAGLCCGQAAAQGVDDVGFVRALVTELQGQLCIDARRIYSTGMSNGGYLSHRLACEASDLFAAIAPVAGVMGIDTCTPTRPMPVLHFHGTADTLVPYDGGGILNIPSVAETIAGWTDRNGCVDAMPEQTYQNGDVTCETYAECDDGVRVTLCTIEGGGHCWPGNPACVFGASTEDISANDTIVEFFADFSLP